MRVVKTCDDIKISRQKFNLVRKWYFFQKRASTLQIKSANQFAVSADLRLSLQHNAAEMNSAAPTCSIGCLCCGSLLIGSLCKLCHP